jgi:hypothetical protein
MVGEFGICASAHYPKSNARYLAPRRDASRLGVYDCLGVHARTLAEARMEALGKWIGLWSGGDVSGAAQRGSREQPALGMHAAND